MDRYFDEMGQFKLLDVNDERQLFSLIENGLAVYREHGLDAEDPEQENALIDLAAAYEAIYVTNLRLVVSIANRYTRYNMLSLPDLIQEGNEGLSTAVRRFDITRGRKFSTFATWWIKQHIRRALGETSRTIRLPIHAHNDWLRVGRAFQNLEQRLGRKPTFAEVAKETDMTEEKVMLLQQAGTLTLTSLNQPIKTDAAEEVGDLIPETEGIEPDLAHLADKDQLRQLIENSSLTERHLLVLSLRFGVYIDQLTGAIIPTTEGEKIYDTIFEAIPPGTGLALEDPLEICCN